MFGFSWFAREQARAPLHLQLQVPKPAGTVRIVLLGESAMMGDPEPTFGMHRFLQDRLERIVPGQRFEVINLGMTAINSHVIRFIAKDVRLLNADAAVILMGNNEMVGPYGPASGSPVLSSRTVAALQSIKKWRVVQLLDSLAGQVGSDPQSGRWAGMSGLMGRSLINTDPEVEQTRQNFKTNLAVILDELANQGVATVLCTVPVNVEQAPFRSIPPSLGSEIANQTWLAALAQADKSYVEGRTREAVEEIDAAVLQHPGHALARHRQAIVYRRQGRDEEAWAALESALDLDTLKFRADTGINNIIRAFSSNADRFVDFAGERPGDRAFLDHVHFTTEQNLKMAHTLAGELVAILPELAHINEEMPSLPLGEELSAAGFTLWDRISINYEMVRRLAVAPFADVPGNSVRVKALLNELQAASEKMQKGGFTVAAENVYRSRLERHPADHDVRVRLAIYLRSNRREPEAMKEIDQVLSAFPHHSEALYEKGRLQILTGHLAQGLATLEEAAALAKSPTIESLIEAGSTLAESGRRSDAIPLFEDAVALAPDDPLALYNLGLALLQEGKPDEGKAFLQKSLQLDPNQPQVERLFAE